MAPKHKASTPIKREPFVVSDHDHLRRRVDSFPGDPARHFEDAVQDEENRRRQAEDDRRTQSITLREEITQIKQVIATLKTRSDMLSILINRVNGCLETLLSNQALMDVKPVIDQNISTKKEDAESSEIKVEVKEET